MKQTEEAIAAPLAAKLSTQPIFLLTWTLSKGNVSLNVACNSSTRYVLMVRASRRMTRT